MTPTATVEDVRDLLDTTVGDEDIQPMLTRAAREVGREYDAEDFADESHRADLESAIVARRIVSSHDRWPRSVRLGNASKTYDANPVGHFRGLVRRADPGDSFSIGGPKRDSDRHVQAANNGGMSP